MASRRRVLGTMATSIYIVLFARDRWWIDLDAHSDGPFPSLESAMAEAVSRAAATSRLGGRSEVRVAGPGHENELIYQSAARSLLSRTVAEAQH
jgi:hypothetical protein